MDIIEVVQAHLVVVVAAVAGLGQVVAARGDEAVAGCEQVTQGKETHQPTPTHCHHCGGLTVVDAGVPARGARLGWSAAVGVEVRTAVRDQNPRRDA